MSFARAKMYGPVVNNPEDGVTIAPVTVPPVMAPAAFSVALTQISLPTTIGNPVQVAPSAIVEVVAEVAVPAMTLKEPGTVDVAAVYAVTMPQVELIGGVVVVVVEVVVVSWLGCGLGIGRSDPRERPPMPAVRAITLSRAATTILDTAWQSNFGLWDGIGLWTFMHGSPRLLVWANSGIFLTSCKFGARHHRRLGTTDACR